MSEFQRCRAVETFLKCKLLGCRRCQRLLPVAARITQAGGLLSNFTVNIWITRLPRGQAVHVAIEHAECGRDKNRVVDLRIGRTVTPGSLNVIRGHMLAALLYLAGDGKKGLQLL